MTSSARLYAVLAAIVVFFLAWATVAAHPWRKAAVDPRLAALEQRRAALRQESLRIRRVLDRRWAAYRVAFARRQQLNAASAARARAAQRVITLPPVVASAPATSSHSS
jgi:hypothetical protein